MNLFRVFLPVLALVPLIATAQTSNDGPTTAADGPLAPILANLVPRQLGPSTMQGRITDLAVFEADPRVFYVASASGGLWKTENMGTTFAPVFDRASTVSLGAVAVSQKDPNIVWVGTGEHTSRNSVAWGDGVYRSTDGGKTWTNLGLKETQFISEIVLDPRNENVAYVAALGKLWGTNKERGIYKTVDAGKTWTKILEWDEKTGVGELVMDPKNPNTLMAAAWTRIRKAYDFTSGGPNDGIYKTTDAGKTWRRITKGMPNTKLGRIGLSYHRANPKIVYATIEYSPLPDEQGRPAEGRPQVRNNAGGTFRSDDGGESWTRVSFLNPRPFYFSNPKADPVDPNRVYVVAVNMHLSTDGGKTFRVVQNTVHPDYHSMWINPAQPKTMLVGTDGGVFQTFDQGAKWRMLRGGMIIGQYYAVAADNRRPYWVYGGLQDNQSWGIASQGRTGTVQFFDTVNMGGGDGFHAQVDPDDWATVYWESQGGAIARSDLRTGAGRGIQPRLAGERLRFNWSTPFIISPHNSKTLYLGANRLFKTVNRGDSWKVISPDLTTNDPEKQKPGVNSVSPEDTGAERHCTIVTVNESPARQGVIWVGTDDGLVHVTQDDGTTWANVTANIPDLPKGIWCTRVQPSRFVESRAYVTFSGHRSDDLKPYVYVTDDFGKTFSKLTNGLPDGDPAYVIVEGRRNPDLLFLGSEMSLRVSLDRGQTWTRYRTNFPTVAVHDLLIHPRELDLIIGTHGRSIWTLDVSALEQMTADARSADAAVFRPQDILNFGPARPLSSWIGDDLVGPANSQPGTRIHFHLKADAPVRLVISDTTGTATQVFTIEGKAGMNVQRWNGRLGGRVAAPGQYRVTMTVGGKDYITSVDVVSVGVAAEDGDALVEDEDKG